MNVSDSLITRQLLSIQNMIVKVADWFIDESNAIL